MSKRKVDVCLVALPTGDRREILPHTGLANISSVLKEKGISAEIIHYLSRAGRNFSDAVLKRIDQLSPKTVGFEVVSDNYAMTQTITASLASKSKGPLIFWGGHLPSMAPELVLPNNKGVDYLVRGYAEGSFPKACEKVLSGEGVDDVKGLAYQQRGHPVINPIDYTDFRKLPRADVKYKKRHLKKAEKLYGALVAMPLEVERGGCYGNCNFCDAPLFSKLFLQQSKKDRFRDPEDVFDEILFWVNEGVYYFSLGSDNPMANPGFMESLIGLHESNKVYSAFSFFSRADDILKNKSLVDRMYSSEYFFPMVLDIGLEAMTQKPLDLQSKGIDVQKNYELVAYIDRLLEKAKHPSMKVIYNIIVFTHPEMSIQDLDKNIDFVIEQKKRKRIKVNTALYTRAYPKTSFWGYLIRKGYEPEPENGFAIYNYRFKDSNVQKLFEKLQRGAYTNK